MELRGDRVVLRPLAEDDVDRIVELGADPEVERWWRGLTREHVLTKARDQDESVAVFAILVEGEVAGMIQYHEELDEEYRHAGIDLFVGSLYQSRGLGTDAVRTMTRHLLADRGHRRLTIDPAAHNERAIRCYEKVGFRRVGIVRECWLDPDGVWRDGLLLDLLASDFTDAAAEPSNSLLLGSGEQLEQRLRRSRPQGNVEEDLTCGRRKSPPPVLVDENADLLVARPS